MEYHHLSSNLNLLPLILAFTLAIFPLFLYSLIRKPKGATNKLPSPPEAEGGWPIIGHLRLFSGSSGPLHILFGKMAEKYGPIFTVKFGAQNTLIVNNSELAKECLTTNDKIFANRPKSLAAEIVGYNNAFFAFSPYDLFVREIRKLIMLNLFSNQQVKKLKPIRESEVKSAIRELYQLWSRNNEKKVVVEMKEWFGDLNENVIFRMIVGKRFSEATNYVSDSSPKKGNFVVGREAMKDFLKLSSSLVVSDGIPWLKWLDLGGYQKAMKKTANDIHRVYQGWIEEHKEKQKIDDHDHDFMDVLIEATDGVQVNTDIHDSDTITKAIALVLLLAGIDTTPVTLTWALALLVNHPEALKKVREEIDQKVGRDRQVKESDTKKMVYLQAVIKETLRLYPPGPFPLPHESNQDCIVGGYHIPANTRLLINIYRIHRDPKVWTDPDEFRPERFLTTHKSFDPQGQNFDFIPFGSGRRVCLGMTLALKIMPLAIASLVHGFEISSPTGEPIDMRETMELTNHKSSLLEVAFTPRLAPGLYE